MDISEFYESERQYDIPQIQADQELTKDIQKILIWLKLLDPPVDGNFGPITADAFREFQKYMGCPMIGILDTETAKKLIETDPTELQDILNLRLRPLDNLAGQIIKYMMLKRYHISIRPDEYNIVYVEGINADGTVNTDAPNQFNDRRIVIQVVDGVPQIIGNWEATTEPGTYYTDRPMRPEGAARIKFDQFKAWQVGAHITDHVNQNPALVQSKPVTVHRDFNRDGFRTSDRLDTGLFGINQHHADGARRHDIGRWGAGCLVGRTKQGHEEFMAILKRDRRYRLNPNYLFETTIIPGDDLLNQFPIV